MRPLALGIIIALWACLGPKMAYCAEVGNERVVLDTLIGEGVSEGVDGMRAIAEVIRNRAEHRGTTMSEECLRPRQFSFWNTPNRASAWLLVHGSEEAYQDAMHALDDALDGSRTVGASRHYYAEYIRTPVWAQGAGPMYKVGKHIFLEGVA